MRWSRSPVRTEDSDAEPRWPRLRRWLRWLRWGCWGLLGLIIVLYLLRGVLLSRPLAMLIERRLATELGGRYRIDAVRGDLLSQVRIEGLQTLEPGDGPVRHLAAKRIDVHFFLRELLAGHGLLAVEDISVSGLDLVVDPSRPLPARAAPDGPPLPLELWPERLQALRFPAFAISGRIRVGGADLRDLRLVASETGGQLTARLPQGPVVLRVERSQSRTSLSGRLPGVEIDAVTLTCDGGAAWMFDVDVHLGTARIVGDVDPRRGRLELIDFDAASLRQLADALGLDPEVLPDDGRLEVRLDGNRRHGLWHWDGRLEARDWSWEGDGLETLSCRFTIGDWRLHIRDLNVRSRTILPALTRGEGSIAFDGPGVRIEQFTALLGDEPLDVSGALDGEGHLDMALRGRNVLLAQDPDLRLRADIDLRLQRDEAGLSLGGRMGITNLLYRKPIRLFYRGTDGAVSESHLQLFEFPDEPLASMRFDIAVQSGALDEPPPRVSPIRVVTELFNGEFDLRLHLGGTGALPVPEGNVYITAGIAALPFGTYRIDQGRVRFTESGRFDPELSISASSRIAAHDVTAVITGSYAQPRIDVITNPPLPPDDALLLATTGMTRASMEQDGMAGAATALLTYMARELSRNFFGVGDLEQEGFFDRMSLQVGMPEGDDGVTTARIDYQLTRKWFVYGERDRHENYNAGLLFRHVFGAPPPPRRDREPFDFQDDTVPWEFDGHQRVQGLGLSLLRRMISYDRHNFLTQDHSASACADAAYTIRSWMTEQGYVNAAVDFTIDRDGAVPQRVRFTIRPGRRFRFGRVRFFGTGALDDSTLHDLLGTAGALGLVSPPFSRNALTDYFDRIRRTYVLRGFKDAAIREHQLHWRDADGLVDVDLFIDEGRRYQIFSTELVIDVADQGLVGRLEGRVRAMRGESYYPRMTSVLEAQIRRTMEEAGHHRSQVRCEPEIRNYGAVHMRVHVDPGPRLHLASLRFDGLDRTRESYLRRVFDLPTGSVIAADHVAAAERRLLASGVLQRLDIDIEPVGEVHDGSQSADVRITVQEAHARSIDLHLGYGSWEQVRAGMVYRDRNLFGRGRYGDIGIHGSMVHYGVRGRLRDTDLLSGMLGPDQRLELSAEFENREEPSFTRTALNTGLALRYFLSDGIWAETAYRLTIQKADDVQGAIPDAEEDGYLRTTWLSLAGNIDRRDHLLQPTKGWKLTGRVSWSIPNFGSQLDVVEYDLETGVHLPLLPSDIPDRPWVVFGVGGRFITRDILGERQFLPIQERLFLGGANTVRSFGYAEMGPRNAAGEAVGGLTRAHASAELRLRLYGDWHTAVFYDIGTVNENSWQLSGRAGQAFGLGLRWYTPVGPLRLDWGWNPDDRPGKDKNWALHGAVGLTF